jgi:hypothetical protein
MLIMKSNATPKISNASKMPCKSWSLPAWESCPSARKSDGKPVDACNYCYALTGAYRFPATIASRKHNMEDWKCDDWVSVMVKKIGKAKYFRWFDSGDCYDTKLAYKIYTVMGLTPNCSHWLPTRMYKDSKFADVFRRMNELENTVVRYSSDSINGAIVMSNSAPTSTIIQSADEFKPSKGESLCRAFTRKGKCASCRACWSKSVKVIKYALHGNKVKDKWFTV